MDAGRRIGVLCSRALAGPILADWRAILIVSFGMRGYFVWALGGRFSDIWTYQFAVSTIRLSFLVDLATWADGMLAPTSEAKSIMIAAAIAGRC